MMPQATRRLRPTRKVPESGESAGERAGDQGGEMSQDEQETAVTAANNSTSSGIISNDTSAHMTFAAMTRSLTTCKFRAREESADS
jgi:hypothetical protein